MKTLLTLTGILLTNVFVFGQSPVSTPAECTKNVSFAVTAGGQPVVSIPGFVVHSIGSEKRQERYPGLCFAQSPDLRAKNYVVIFSTKQENFTGLVPTVLKYINAAPLSEDAALNTVYGEMWHYTLNEPAALGIPTLNLLQMDTSTALFARAYNEQGAIVSQLSLKDISGWWHTKEKLLDRVLGEIRADSGRLTASQVPVKTSLPVYYVNCDVPVGSLATKDAAVTSPPDPAVTPPPAPAVPPPPLATIEFWSSPAGADVYVDGELAGNTPSSVTIAPGEHTIVLRKPNFGIWQRKVLVTAGKRRIAAYLEQKTLDLQ